VAVKEEGQVLPAGLSVAVHIGLTGLLAPGESDASIGAVRFDEAAGQWSERLRA
jgi:hypothetical protein